MRRTASEVLKSLEQRVAHLERVSVSTEPELIRSIQSQLSGATIKRNRLRGNRVRFSVSLDNVRFSVFTDEGTLKVNVLPQSTSDLLGLVSKISLLASYLETNGSSVSHQSGMQSRKPSTQDLGLNTFDLFKSQLIQKFGDRVTQKGSSLSLKLKAFSADFWMTNGSVNMQPNSVVTIVGSDQELLKHIKSIVRLA